MSIEFICPNTYCEKKLSVLEEKAGMKVRCPGCKEVLSVPVQSGDVGATVVNDSGEAEPESSFLSELEPILADKGVGLSGIRTDAEIAQGGMGKIMLCQDQGLGRPVAMKIMRSNIAASNDHRLRFLEEARVIGQLEHPNIVPIHELGKDESGDLYFTMKLVKGSSLGEILKGMGAWEDGRMGGQDSEHPHSTTPTLQHLLRVR